MPTTTHSEDTSTSTVAVIGLGAAGIAAVWSLANHPPPNTNLKITAFEKQPGAGGVATSEIIKGINSQYRNPKSKTNHPQIFKKPVDRAENVESTWEFMNKQDLASNEIFVNDGVQGLAPSYRNVIKIFELYGFKPTPVHMKISFNRDSKFWSNHGEPSQFVKQRQKEIKRFGNCLKHVHRFEKLYVAVPIDKILSIWRFSNNFRFGMVYPLVALFFGTGNQTPHVSSAIVARVFLDPNLRLFDYDEDRLLSQQPKMFAFPNLSFVYRTITNDLQSKENVDILLNEEVVRVKRLYTGRKRHNSIEIHTQSGNIYHFDDVIFACDAETILKVLERPTFFERFALGNVQYYSDVSVTHTDQSYMESNYHLDLSRGDQYFIRVDPLDSSKLEMSFDLTNYQPQLKYVNLQGKNQNETNQNEANQNETYQRELGSETNQHVFQTIFLNEKERQFWTCNQIKSESILLVKWWRQFSHRWSHYVAVVPFFRFMNSNKRHTFYCGSYTLVNTHEIAIISGLAAAWRLGCSYPFNDDELARQQFCQYVGLIHGKKV